MALTSIFASPSVALVGQKVQLTPVGAYDTALELRWYLATAPPSSSLLTLATYETEGKERADARLKANNGEIIAQGESYTTRAAAHAGVEAVKRIAPGARTEDL